jgi:hypothetical protein
LFSTYRDHGTYVRLSFLFQIGPEQAQARARVGVGLGQSPRAWIFCIFSKSLSPSPILLNKHPGPQKAWALSVKPEPDPRPHFVSPIRPYFLSDSCEPVLLHECLRKGSRESTSRTVDSNQVETVPLDRPAGGRFYKQRVMRHALQKLWKLGRFLHQKIYFYLWNGLAFIVSEMHIGNFSLKNRPMGMATSCFSNQW